MVILCGFRIIVRCGNAVFVIIAYKKVSARFTGLRCLAEQGKGFLVFIFIEQIASVKILVVGVALGGVNAVQLFVFFRLRRQYAFNTVDVHQHKVRTSGCHAAVKRAFVPVFTFQHIFVNEAFKSLVAVKILVVDVFYH